jgi:asparagine synthase (glutamine-hydrolysing)
VLPLLDVAKGGWLIAGGGSMDFYLYWYWAPLLAALRQRKRPRRRDLALLATLLPGRTPNPLVRRHFRGPHMPWLREEAAVVAERLLAEAFAAPIRFDAAVARQRTHRCYVGALRGLELLAAAAEAQILIPLRSDRYLGALAAAGGRFGFGDRREAIARVGGHLVPDEVLRRRDDPGLQEVFVREQTREFVARWSGTGVDPDVVDPEVLRHVWSQDQVDWRASMLLQLAAAHDRSIGEGSPRGSKVGLPS